MKFVGLEIGCNITTTVRLSALLLKRSSSCCKHTIVMAIAEGNTYVLIISCQSALLKTEVYAHMPVCDFKTFVGKIRRYIGQRFCLEQSSGITNSDCCLLFLETILDLFSQCVQIKSGDGVFAAVSFYSSSMNLSGLAYTGQCLITLEASMA